MKKVSLLMMTHNCMENIKTTLDSVCMQDYPEIELVIADACSTDGTLAVLEQYRSQCVFPICLVSEPDDGLYDALNKTIRRASGDYLLVCNDELLDAGAVRRLVDAAECSGLDGAHADLIYADDDHVHRYWHMGNGSIYRGWLPGHPTMLVKKEIYERFGEYDTSYRIAADYEYMLRMFTNGVRLAYVPEVLVRMFYGGTSTGSLQDYILSFREGCRALRSNGVHGGFFISVLRFFRVASQFLNRSKAEELWKKRN